MIKVSLPAAIIKRAPNTGTRAFSPGYTPLLSIKLKPKIISKVPTTAIRFLVIFGLTLKILAIEANNVF